MVKQKNIPQLRFPEFEGDWETNKIGKIFSISAGGDISKENVSSTKTDIFKYPIYANAEKDKGFYAYSNIFKFDKDVVTIAGRGVNMGIAHARKDKFYPIVRLLVLEPTIESSVVFWEYAINKLNFYVESTGVPQLTAPQISTYKISFPTLPEQQKIASFFTAIDQKISQLKRKKTLLEQYKKGVMQKIFSQQFRFKDDNGQEFPKWEKKKFGDVYSFKNNNSYPRESLNYEKGSVKNIHYGDIHTKLNTWFDITKEEIPYINENLPIERISLDNYCKEGDLVFADASEDLTDVGKSIELVNLNNEKVLSGLHTILARPDLSKMAIGFGGYMAKSIAVRKQIMKEAQGSKVSSISAKKLSGVQLNIPNQEEQTKIANFLSAIDDKINHTEKQMEKAEVWKKGLMQQMFV